MPIYEYECDKCLNWSEEQHTPSKMPKAIPCHTCGESAVRRIKSAPAVNVPLKHRATGDHAKYYYTTKEQKLNARMGRNPK